MDYKFFIVAWGKSHFVSRITFVKEVSLSDHEIKKWPEKTFNSSDLLTNGQVKFIKSVLKHSRNLLFIKDSNFYPLIKKIWHCKNQGFSNIFQYFKS